MVMTKHSDEPGSGGNATSARPKQTARTAKKVAFYGGLLILVVIFIAPLLWMLSTSFKTTAGATRMPLRWIPETFSTAGYDTILRAGGDTPVLRWFANSMIAATAHAALVVTTAAPAAYALARMEFRLKKVIFPLIVATLFIPPIMFLTPNFLIVDWLGWIDSLLALIVPTAAGAFGVFFLRQFFLNIPIELEEAAYMDGASPFTVFMRIVVPLSKPALATLVVLSFLTNWNDFLWPVYVLFTRATQTLPPGLATLQGAYTTNYPIIMAGAVVASVPVLILFVFAQRFIIEGVAHTGVKG